ncbi:hypothetical protein P175DRAFT_0497275 [Aspergillus ochraceoroseus IBT 24754]|uniref:Uncharacterized protein n=1 Tax=Aspergillus ochraceoroseus IBT 24754 TaxID=1392256 RepID=A0A2T5M6J7_9EURO|nr:uncharacterized protein P175DRAFT_0497275 [Aspergillus ochraceoroseus IBT 24754]PTU24157.1 hypothetical protein P175DRAFT_0497275 [Aspergillus ochraceoroseus IBT 24754]
MGIFTTTLGLVGSLDKRHRTFLVYPSYVSLSGRLIQLSPSIDRGKRGVGSPPSPFQRAKKERLFRLEEGIDRKAG